MSSTSFLLFTNIEHKSSAIDFRLQDVCVCVCWLAACVGVLRDVLVQNINIIF